jgi:hypothetical protein
MYSKIIGIKKTRPASAGRVFFDPQLFPLTLILQNRHRLNGNAES